MGCPSAHTPLRTVHSLPLSIVSGTLPQPADFCFHLVKGACQSQWAGVGYLGLKRKGRGEALLWGWIWPCGLSESPMKLGPQGGGEVERTPMLATSLNIFDRVWFEDVLLPVPSTSVLFCSITNLNGLEMELLGQSGICYKTLWVFSWQERC